MNCVELVRISQVTHRTRQVLKLQYGIIRCHHKLYYYDYKNRRLSRYISSVQELNEDSIEFSLSTQIRSRFKSLWLESYSLYA